MKTIEYLSYVITFALICTAIFHWIKNKIRPMQKMGFTFDNKTTLDIRAALVICGITVSFIFLADLSFDFIKIQDMNPPKSVFFKFILFLLIAAFIEELINRGLLINGLSVPLKKNWQVIIVAAIIFGLGHAKGEGVSLLSILSNAMGGAIYTIAFLGAKNIWFPWALHFSWNTFQFFYGYPVSGLKYDSIVAQTEIKDTIWNGGSYGPEGGLIGIFFRIAILVLILFYFRRHRLMDIQDIFK